MPNSVRKIFVPLCRMAHWPESKSYTRQHRKWLIDQTFQGSEWHDVKTVLEIGCGDGWVGQQLASRFPRVLGFDINPNRISSPNADNLDLLAANVSHPPIREGSVDLVVSVAVLEHLPDPVTILKQLTTLLRPNGRMVHIVPNSGWKTMQWLLFAPNIARKHFRSISRSLAGQSKRKTAKYYQGRETNNPSRISRRVWYRKFYPRIHGEYDSNLQEFLEWMPNRWAKLFQSAGLRTVRQIPMGLSSPYSFGLSKHVRRVLKGRLPCTTAFILEPESTANTHEQTSPRFRPQILGNHENSRRTEARRTA